MSPLAGEQALDPCHIASGLRVEDCCWAGSGARADRRSSAGNRAWPGRPTAVRSCARPANAQLDWRYTPRAPRAPRGVDEPGRRQASTYNAGYRRRTPPRAASPWAHATDPQTCVLRSHRPSDMSPPTPSSTPYVARAASGDLNAQGIRQNSWWQRIRAQIAGWPRHPPAMTGPDLRVPVAGAEGLNNAKPSAELASPGEGVVLAD